MVEEVRVAIFKGIEWLDTHKLEAGTEREQKIRLATRSLIGNASRELGRPGQKFPEVLQALPGDKEVSVALEQEARALLVHLREINC